MSSGKQKVEDMTDGNSSRPIPTGWSFKTEVQKDGSKLMYYHCKGTGQHFFNYSDLMRYVEYAKEGQLGMYSQKAKREDNIPTKSNKESGLTVQMKPSCSKSKKLIDAQSMASQLPPRDENVNIKDDSDNMTVSDNSFDSDYQPSETELEVIHILNQESNEKKSRSLKRKKKQGEDSDLAKSKKKTDLSIRRKPSSGSKLISSNNGQSKDSLLPTRNEFVDLEVNPESQIVSKSHLQFDCQPSETELKEDKVPNKEIIEKNIMVYTRRKNLRKGSVTPTINEGFDISFFSAIYCQPTPRNETTNVEIDSKHRTASESNRKSDYQSRKTELQVIQIPNKENGDGISTKIWRNSEFSDNRKPSFGSNSKSFNEDQTMASQSPPRNGSVEMEESYVRRAMLEKSTVKVDSQREMRHLNRRKKTCESHHLLHTEERI